MTVARTTTQVCKTLLMLAVGLSVSGCIAMSVATGVVGAGVAVASTAVDVGVAVGSTAVSATTTVVKAAIPGD